MKEKNILKQLLKKNNHYYVMSFDIFDTIIFRKVERPEKIFEITASKGKEMGYIDKFISSKEWAKIRIEAEKKARKNKKEKHGNSEANIYDIYNAMPIPWKTKKLLNLELLVEKEYCYANPEFLDILSILSEKKVILISDMYIPKKEMIELLEKVGISQEMYSDIYISCDFGCSKMDENLYKCVISNEGNSILHIGDNYISDFMNAKKNGIQSEHYTVINSQHEVFLYEDCYIVEALPCIESLRKLVYDEGNNFWGKFGATILGPFFSAFGEWVIDYADENKCDLILPIMREGSTFEDLLKNEINYRINKIDVKKFYASREATQLLSAGEWNRELYDSFYRYKEKSTVRSIIEWLDLSEIGELMHYSECLLRDAKDIIINDSINLYEFIWEILNKDEYRTKISELIQEKRRTFFLYYSNMTYGYNKILLVDIGYSGTIQRNIQKMLKSMNKDMPLCVVAVGDPNIKNNFFMDYMVRSFISTTDYGNKLRKILTNSIDVIEQLLMNHEGTTTGYMETDSATIPVIAMNTISKKELEKRESCQKGIFFYQRQYKKLRNSGKLCEFDQDKKQNKLFDIIARVYMVPTEEEAKELLKLTYEDRLNDRERHLFFEKGEEEDLVNLGTPFYLKYGRDKGVKWPEGILTLFDRKYLLEKVCESDKGTDSHEHLILDLLNILKRNEINCVTVYGAGELGRKISGFAYLYGIHLNGFIDKSIELNGSFIDNIKVYSLESAIEEINMDHIIIASIAYKKEIEKTLNNYLPNSRLYCL